MFKRLLKYFTKTELLLWLGSVLLILASFLIFDRGSYLTLSASIIGACSLILNAKGNPIGQLLMVIFSLLYGMISFSFAYYGEMLSYLGMTMPMAVFAMITWLQNPYKGKKTEVEVGHISKRELGLACVLTCMVTLLFYFILRFFGTANLLPSTLSITTSFLAVYLSCRRSPYYAVCYAANDIVLIILWVLAAMEDISYASVVVCFAAFLANDIYGFVNWRHMKKRQAQTL